ncbi:MAG: hypothetical protein JNM39_07350 [Bdellovibrionaceae bacterium]|nr:hypothetical protein [Pseudobdellovibrionaceae bacterium]
MQSCAHKEIVGGLVNESPKYQVEFDFSGPDTVKRQLETMGDLRKRENQQKLVQFLIAFQRLTKEPTRKVLTFSPFSKTQIEVITFCASSRKAIPEKNEIFHWAKGLPKIQLLKEVLDLYRKKSDLNRQSIQEIVWNLENGTLYENYPDNLKTILQQASPSAPLILPSTLKSEVTEIFMLEEIKNAAALIRGQYHSYREFKNFAEQRKSNLPLARNQVFSSLPNTHILTSTTSNGYESQLVSFYNSTPSLQNIVVSDYYLKPLRADVQPLVLASVLPYAEEIQKLLEQAALKLLGYIGSQYPTLNKEEKQLVKERPIESAIVLYNAIIAEQKAEEFYPNSKPNGESDAFRHYVWSGLLVRDVGEDRASAFLNAHEATLGQSDAEKAMDQFNNDQGISASKDMLEKEYFNNSTILERAKNDLEAGRLKVLAK